MSKAVAFVLVLTGTLSLAAIQRESIRVLSEDERRQLIENVPEVRAAKFRYSRPDVELLGATPDVLRYQVRSTLTKGAASGLINNYEVDRRTARVSRGLFMPGGDEVQSNLIALMQKQFLATMPGVPITIEIQSPNLLANIQKANAPVRYSLWGAVTGTPFNLSKVPSGVHTIDLLPDLRTGQLLSGFTLNHPVENSTPIIEAYLNDKAEIVEIYVEVAVFRNSFDDLFGQNFTDAILTIENGKWKSAIGAEVVERQAKFGNTDAFFADAPAKGICACMTGGCG